MTETDEARKAREIAFCWEVREDYDWTAEHDLYEEEEEMWDDYEALALRD